MQLIIARQDFTAAIEAGIRAATDLTDDECAALRSVASEATRSARGDWRVDDCACPLSQIGDFHDDSRGQGFVAAYDDASRKALRKTLPVLDHFVGPRSLVIV